MKTFNLLLGLVLGLVIGLLTSLSALLFGALWFVTDDKKKPLNRTRTYETRDARATAFNHEYDSRLEAEEMLDMMEEIIKSQGRVTVEDLKVGTGYPPTFADRQMGWKSLKEAKVERPLYGAKYRIFFPKPETW